MARELTPWAATAKAVRAAIKNDRAALNIPATATIKVTSDHFAGGASVDVNISGVDDWAWRPATEHDVIVRSYHGGVGTPTLSAQARVTGEAVARLIAEHRAAGYIWGAVTYGLGTVIGTVAREGWTPGQD